MKKILLSLFIVMAVFSITGCGKKEEKKDNTSDIVEVKSNTKVGYLNYYVPEDYKYYPDYRGLAYTENERKIHIKGDFTDDSDAIVIDVYVNEYDGSLYNYIETVNSNLTDNDIKYVIKSNNKIAEMYAREEYITKSGDINKINYAYMCEKGGYIHTITLRGPEAKKGELETLVKNILASLNF